MHRAPSIPLPRGWPAHIKRALVHAVALARAALIDVRAGLENSPLLRARLVANNDRLRSENALLKEELRIKDARMERIAPSERPYYPPAERLAILVLRAAAGWNAATTAKRFLLTAATIASWMQRLDEKGPAALVQTPQPVNQFPQFVTLVVQKLRAAVPGIGRRKVAECLARAGLHLAPSTARRLSKKTPRSLPPPPDKAAVPARAEVPGAAKRCVTARFAHHVWHVDLSVVPTLAGFWVPWIPFSFALRWPFCWWVVAVLDHHSRAVIAHGLFDKEPSAREVSAVLDRAVERAGRAPRHIVSDQGAQFRDHYRAWCKKHGARPRFGAIGQHGSIAIIERFFRTLKYEGLRRIVVPLAWPAMQSELNALILWYNIYRPHAALQGATPQEVLDGTVPACRQPAIESRARYPIAASASATPLRRRVRGRLELVVAHVQGRAHLPVVALREVA